MATAKKAAVVSKTDTARTDIAAKLGVTLKQLRTTKTAAFTDAARAKAVGVKASDLTLVRTPIVLTPAAPIKGSSNLLLFTSMMVDPTWPAGTGEALFSSGFPGAVDPGVQVAFQRIKTGKNHLVEFYVQLNMSVPYKFRVFTYPLGDFVDVTIQGPKTTVITALAPPVDQIPGALELGAAISQRNTVQDNAGWMFTKAQISALG